MNHDDLVIIGRVAGALAFGAMIGFERTFHGRPAGFRTHSLVCIASAILMIVTVYQTQWMTLLEHDAIRTDPTRMAQGIMTGIGFLGAGVIFKEGLTVRGVDYGRLYLGYGGDRHPSRHRVLVRGGCRNDRNANGAGAVPTNRDRAAKRVLCSSHVAVPARQGDGRRQSPPTRRRSRVQHCQSIRRLIEGGQEFEYRMTIKSRNRQNAERLAAHLRGLPERIELRITPTGDKAWSISAPVLSAASFGSGSLPAAIRRSACHWQGQTHCQRQDQPKFPDVHPPVPS